AVGDDRPLPGARGRDGAAAEARARVGSSGSEAAGCRGRTRPEARIYPLSVPRLLLLLLVAVALVAAGCGGDEEPATTETVTTTLPTVTSPGRAYWLRNGKVWPVARELETPAVAASALATLFEGPTAQEASDLAAKTAIPAGAIAPDVSIEDGVAHVETG